MNLRCVGIGARLAVGMATLLVLAATLLGVSVWNGARDRALIDATVKAANKRTELAQGMHQALLRTAIAARNIGLQTTVDGVNAAEASAKKAQAEYQIYRKQLEEAGLSVDEKALLADLVKVTAQADRHFDEAVGLAQQFNTEQAAAMIAGKIDPLTTQTEALLQRFSALQRSQSEAALAQAEQRSAQTLRTLLLLGLGALAVAAGIGWRITLSIVSPLRQAVEVAQRVAQGDLTRRAIVVGSDETAQLLHALNGMNESLSRVVSEVRQCSDSIATGSEEIANGNLDLSARTEQQASALQQTATSMDELSTTVSQSAGNAQQASQLAQGAADVAERGGRVVTEVVSTMRGISESSQRIAEIIGTIDSIAFQTNILALNAAVEAARAGEQGRGFAVVATEVRTLAHRSADAAKEIRSLISASVERVEHGNTQVAQAGATMQDIVHAINRVNGIIAEISVTSQEQSRGVGQIGQAVTQIDHATQQNSALVEQSAAAAESLKLQAERLVGAVSVFKLNAGGASNTASKPEHGQSTRTTISA